MPRPNVGHTVPKQITTCPRFFLETGSKTAGTLSAAYKIRKNTQPSWTVFLVRMVLKCNMEASSHLPGMNEAERCKDTYVFNDY
jgi:hypothetical protein